MDVVVSTASFFHQQLNVRGKLISDEDFTNTLLTSLPDTWSPFITTINASGVAISSEVLIARILDEDCTQQTSMAWQTALKANTPGKKPKGGPGDTKGKCRNCGKKGCYEKDCWAKGGSKENQAPAWFKQPKEKDLAKQSKMLILHLWLIIK